MVLAVPGISVRVQGVRGGRTHVEWSRHGVSNVTPREKVTLLAIGPIPPPLNGMTVMTSHALVALRQRGWDVVHVDTSDHRPVGNVGRLDIQNVLLAVKHALRLSRATKGTGPQILYLPIAQGNLGFLRDAVFFEIARAKRIPVVAHLHGAAFQSFYSRTNAPMRWLIRRCIGNCRRGIVLSDSLRAVFGDLLPEATVGVVPNGIPLAIRAAQVSRPKPERLSVLFLSNLSEGKGYRDFLEAARLVSEVRQDIMFRVAGEWPSRKDIKRSREWVEKHKLGGSLQFVGSPSGLRKRQLLDQSDLFVFPPRQIEGQPVVLLEAMSHSLPVIATPMGGIVDIVRPGHNGLLVTPGDPSGLADAILQLAGDPDLRTRMGQAGRRLYETNHTPERMAISLDQVFRALLAEAA